MYEADKIKQKRIAVYLPENDYRILRSKLILEGKTASQWVREQIKKFLKETD